MGGPQLRVYYSEEEKHSARFAEICHKGGTADKCLVGHWCHKKGAEQVRSIGVAELSPKQA